MVIGENTTPADESESSESNEIQSDSQNICIQPQSVSGNKLIRLFDKCNNMVGKVYLFCL